jgi:hypothetical protein
MVRRSDIEAVPHNPRHSELLTGQRLQRTAAATELPGTELLGERLKTWGVRPDDPSVDAGSGRTDPLSDGLGELLVLGVGEDRHLRLTFARQDCMIPAGAAWQCF